MTDHPYRTALLGPKPTEHTRIDKFLELVGNAEYLLGKQTPITDSEVRYHRFLYLQYLGEAYENSKK